MDSIVSITDREGNLKQEQMQNIINTYGGLDGEILYKDLTKTNGCLCFVYANQDNKMMRTSTVEQLDKFDDKWIVKTRNSIYTFLISR